MRTGTLNTYHNWSRKWGGVRKVFEGQVKILVGGFKFDLKDLPLSGNVLPCGTPVNCDEEARTIKPLYAFEVVAVDGTAVSIKKYGEGTRAKVGMSLIVCPEDLSTAASVSASVQSIESTDEEVDVLTLSAEITGLAVGDVLVEAGENKKIKVVPNALTPYDTCIDDTTHAADGDGCWNCMEKPVLVRRMPPLTPAIKQALADNGCFFRWSNRM